MKKLKPYSKELLERIKYILGDMNDDEMALGYLGIFEEVLLRFGEDAFKAGSTKEASYHPFAENYEQNEPNYHDWAKEKLNVK